MRNIHSIQDFEALLRAERAVVFISFPWSKQSLESQAVFQRWLAQEDKNLFAVYELAPDALPFTWQWVNEAIGKVEGEGAGSGAVIWLKQGVAAGMEPDAARAGVKILSRATRDYFAPEKNSAAENEDTVELDAELLKIICCPETHQELRLAASPVVASLNQQIAGGRLQNRAGQPVMEKINGGLVRKDGQFLYPVRHNIPVLLVDEAIPLMR